MFLKPDFLALRARIALGAGLGVLALLLVACSAPPAPARVPEATGQGALKSAPTPVSAPGSAAPTGSAPASAGSASAALVNAAAPPAALPASVPAALPSADAALLLLAYADRMRALSTPELVQEIVRLGNPSAPSEQLQLALALSQVRQTPELARAQELLNRITSSAAPDAQPLQPLARLLAARYGEQRRVEDQLEKQAQQLRDTQRRLDQTRERLEALKAIERSLTSRLPAPVASATSAATAATPTSAASAPTSRHRRSAP
jgi:hypothetical protein